MARVIAISNQKGGVGKTTTAINLATSIAAQGNRVLLMDLDPQANATSGIGVDTSLLTSTMYEAFSEEVSLSEVIVASTIKDLYVAPANQDLSGIEIELVSAIGREHRLKDILGEVVNDYDFIFMDTPPTLGLITVNALTAADSILVPIQSEYYSLEGLSQLIKTTSLIQKRLNPNLEREGFLITMFDKRNKLSSQVLEEIKQHFSDDLFETVIPRNIKLSEAPSHGLPVLSYDLNSKGSQAYLAVARELLSRYPKAQSKSTFTKSDLSGIYRI